MADPATTELLRQAVRDGTIPPEQAAQILAQAEMGGGGDPIGIFTSGRLTGDEEMIGGFQPIRPNKHPVRTVSTPGGPSVGPEQPSSPFMRTTSGEVLKQFYRMEGSHLRRIQAMLYAGGFYGNLDLTDIRWGESDDASFSAWANAVARTARLNAIGTDITVRGVIREAAMSAGLDVEELEDADPENLSSLLEALGPGGEEEGRAINILLSDPAGLRSTMDQVASAVLGRKANPAEQRMFVSMIHSVQRQGQTAMQTAEPEMVPVGADGASALELDDSMIQLGDVVTEYAAPDEGAQAEELLRSENPEEAGAHDIALQFANLLEMLPAPVDVPRITLG